VMNRRFGFRLKRKRRPANPDTDLWYLTTGVLASDVICAYQPKTALSLANSYVNLVTPGTGDAVATVAPTWNSTDGWIFNGSTQYLDTGTITINQNLTVLVRYSGANPIAYPTNGLFGYYVTNNMFQVSFGDDGKGAPFIFGRVGDVYAGGAAIPTSGVIGLTKDGNYIDGSFTRALFSVPTPFTLSHEMGVGAATTETTPIYYLVGNIQAIAFYNKTLTAPQIAQITIYMQSL
jgi:hypothetical protein